VSPAVVPVRVAAEAATAGDTSAAEGATAGTSGPTAGAAATSRLHASAAAPEAWTAWALILSIDSRVASTGHQVIVFAVRNELLFLLLCSSLLLARLALQNLYIAGSAAEKSARPASQVELVVRQAWWMQFSMSRRRWDTFLQRSPDGAAPFFDAVRPAQPRPEKAGEHPAAGGATAAAAPRKAVAEAAVAAGVSEVVAGVLGHSVAAQEPLMAAGAAAGLSRRPRLTKPAVHVLCWRVQPQPLMAAGAACLF
jgi:hypothetical protein